jgi:hypothetical protein
MIAAIAMLASLHGLVLSWLAILRDATAQARTDAKESAF